MIEPAESRKRACQREIKEIGLEHSVGRLRCVDYEIKDRRGAESLKFIFDGGIVTQAQAKIILQEDELSAYTFAPFADALEKLNAFSSRRTERALIARKNGGMVYLENQELS